MFQFPNKTLLVFDAGTETVSYLHTYLQLSVFNILWNLPSIGKKDTIKSLYCILKNMTND